MLKLIGMAAALGLLAVPGALVPGVHAASAPRPQAEPFDLRDVSLLPGPFRDAMDRDRDYLLKLEPDRLLHGFRAEAGLPEKAPAYGGWESRGLSGHTLGHYLSALSLYYRATGDRRFKERVDHIVRELAEVQRANGNGFVGGMPNAKALFANIAAGKLDSSGFDLNGAWVPWYNLHKTFAGLLDAYSLADNRQARDVVVGMADWAYRTTQKLTDAQWQTMLATEHGGMNESLASVYAITRNPKHLELARKFHHNGVLDPLEQGQDRLTGLHGNTQIPKVIGLARLYELTGDAKGRAAATFFWDRIVRTRSYAIGGDTDYEHLPGPNELAAHLSPSTAETCNTYNMLKLTRHLFTWEPKAEYADYYERALYNQILAQQDPERGMFQYYHSLKPGHFKTYSTPFDSFWCCVGTGMENHVKYGDSIYFHGNNDLYVNLLIPSQVRWREKGLAVRQETAFPDQETTRLVISAPKPVRLALKVRYPSWSGAAAISVNGKKHPVTDKPGSYITLDRTWKSGDKVEARFPMRLTTEALPDDRNKVAVLYGPIVLAGQIGQQGLKPPIPYAEDQTAYFGVPDPDVPVIVNDNKPVRQWIRPLLGQPLTFSTVGAEPKDVTLRPYFRTPYDRYTVYWDTFTPEAWAKRQAAFRAEQERERDLEARTLDAVCPGEQQPEVDHKMRGERAETGLFNGRRWRHAVDGGWFEYRLKVVPDAPLDLVCTYWGGDTGGRSFDILVDGIAIGAETLDQPAPGRFIDRAYPIPPAVLAGKEYVTVRFQAKPGNVAGGIYGVRIVRRKEP